MQARLLELHKAILKNKLNVLGKEARAAAAAAPSDSEPDGAIAPPQHPGRYGVQMLFHACALHAAVFILPLCLRACVCMGVAVYC